MKGDSPPKACTAERKRGNDVSRDSRKSRVTGKSIAVSLLYLFCNDYAKSESERIEEMFITI